jgi:hypothetical protein
MLNIIPILVCAVPLVAALYLIWVWLDRGEDQLVRGDDPRADKSVDPVVKHRDYEEYPVKDTETSPSDDSEIWW